MSVSGGPDIVQDGLVLTLDVANDRSFRGEPTTNYVANPEFTSTSNWSVGTNGSSSFSVSNGFGKLTPPTGGTFAYLRQSITLAVPSNTTGTFSTFYKNDRVGTYGVRLVYQSGSTVLIQPQKNITLDGTGGLRRLEITGSSATAATTVLLDILSGPLYGLTSSDVEFTKAQFELKPYATAFVSGTRGTTVATGGGWADVSGNGNNGELVNGPTYNSSNLGSLVFDGVNDYVSIPLSSYPSSYTDNYTMSIWVYIPTGVTWYNAGSGTGIFARGNFGGSFGLLRTSTDNQIRGFVRLNSGIANVQGPTYNITRDTWYNIVTTWSGTRVEIFGNGTYQGGTDISPNTNFGGGNFLIGGGGAYGGTSGGFGAGRYTNAIFYTRVLTPQEILQNFNATRSRFGV
jgi:hypothetical protein